MRSLASSLPVRRMRLARRDGTDHALALGTADPLSGGTRAEVDEYRIYDGRPPGLSSWGAIAGVLETITEWRFVSTDPGDSDEMVSRTESRLPPPIPQPRGQGLRRPSDAGIRTTRGRLHQRSSWTAIAETAPDAARDGSQTCDIDAQLPGSLPTDPRGQRRHPLMWPATAGVSAGRRHGRASDPISLARVVPSRRPGRRRWTGRPITSACISLRERLRSPHASDSGVEESPPRPPGGQGWPRGRLRLAQDDAAPGRHYIFDRDGEQTDWRVNHFRGSTVSEANERVYFFGTGPPTSAMGNRR